jgi:N-acetylneuraminate synthase
MDSSDRPMGVLRSDRPILIGEVGINHNGDLETALKIIKMAKNSGVDFVKFQKRTPEICVPISKREQVRQTPWGEMTYFEYKQKIEFWENEYDAINEFCKELEIGWSASCWDIPSLEFIDKYEVPFHKVASALITNTLFLQSIAQRGKLTFLSTGMCELSDIDRAVEIFKSWDCPLILLHSVSTYPAQEGELNLKCIPMLRKRYQLHVGYSGHENSVSPSFAAAILGAVAIERHITLDRTMWGTDQSASLEESGVRHLVELLKKSREILGDGEKRFLDSEKKAAENLRYW